MKTPELLLAALVAASSILNCNAQSATPLPFPVSLGGIAAAAEAGKPFAVVDKPVAADADITVGVQADRVIINATKTGPDGSPVPGSQPAVIILQHSQTGSLAKTMDKQKLAPGNYLLSISAAAQTASIRFTIK